MTSGEGILIVSTAAAQRRALFIVALTVVLGTSRFVTESWAAGAFAIGKCGAYGQAYDYAGEAGALAAARKQCKGECTDGDHEAGLRGVVGRHDQSLRRPWLRGRSRRFRTR